MLDKKIDYITLNGDLLAHKISGDIPINPSAPTVEELVSDAKHYAVNKLTHKIIQEMFTEAFPTTPVFITFGNNDALYHDNPAWANNSADYYNYMYKTWFVNHPPNRQFQS